MSNVWERFEGIASVDEVKEAKDAFSPTPAGTYEVILDKIEASLTQSGLPMLKGQFTSLEGGRKIFYNHVLQNINNPQYTPRMVEDARKFVEKLLGDDVEFEGIAKLASLVTTIPVGDKYVIKVAYGAKDFDQKFAKITVIKKIPDSYEDDSDEEMTEF